MTDRLRHANGLPDDWIDRAPLLADEEVLAGLDGASQAEVTAIRGALAALDAGTYGICTACGEAIPAGRLASLPTATTCVDCGT